MRQTKQGWTAADLERLYVGFGFAYRDKGKHRVYTHPAHKGLIATVTHHRHLAVGYIQTAIKLIDQLKALQGGRPGDSK
jgi:hypothetical protein